MEGQGGYDSVLDNLEATELRLGLPGIELPERSTSTTKIPRGSKRALEAETDEECPSGTNDLVESSQAPMAKAQVVGWPPIRSYRRNSIQMRKKEATTDDYTGIYVKVSMDGAPFLRKIDLKVYKGYKELIGALEGMFKCFSMGKGSGEEGCDESEYVITYQDKDGDWMMVGDVPWEMFTTSCKRLRIMKGSDARGLGSSP